MGGIMQGEGGIIRGEIPSVLCYDSTDGTSDDIMKSVVHCFY